MVKVAGFELKSFNYETRIFKNSVVKFKNWRASRHIVKWRIFTLI